MLTPEQLAVIQKDGLRYGDFDRLFQHVEEQAAEITTLQTGLASVALHRQECETEIEQLKAGFDADGCTAAESCCGDIKAALQDEIERLTARVKELEAQIEPWLGWKPNV